MSQSYEPEYPARDHTPRRDGDNSLGYQEGHLRGQDDPGGQDDSGGRGYARVPSPATEPPRPPRGPRTRLLLVTGTVALAAGATAGGVMGTMNSTPVHTATTTSRIVLSPRQVATKMDPALGDVVSTDGDQDATSAGTGIVLTSNGLVLTNNHVIEGATAVKVTDIGNGATYTATVVGYDATQDVAVIQLQNASGLTTADLGDSATVAAGDSVVALGNAGGKGGTPSVATGMVTALNQSITASDALSGLNEQLTGLIEANADIQPGDSGGSLVNSYGQVIGVDTAASSEYQLQGQSGQTAEQAYAIPIDQALSTVKQIEGSTSTADIHIGATGFLGVEIQPSSDRPSGQGGVGGPGNGNADGATGVAIAGTLPGSPAASAGLTGGDAITAIGGQPVSTAKEIANALVPYHPGSSLSVGWVDQYGQARTSIVILASGPAA
jgi:S1-C subfamily serine protease